MTNLSCAPGLQSEITNARPIQQFPFLKDPVAWGCVLGTVVASIAPSNVPLGLSYSVPLLLLSRRQLSQQEENQRTQTAAIAYLIQSQTLIQPRNTLSHKVQQLSQSLSELEQQVTTLQPYAYTKVVRKLQQIQDKQREIQYQQLLPQKQLVETLQKQVETLQQHIEGQNQAIQHLQQQIEFLQQRQSSVTTPPIRSDRPRKKLAQRNPNDRVFVFIDAANLFKCAEEHNLPFDYEQLQKLCSLLHVHPKTDTIRFYTGVNPHNPREEKLLTDLHKAGYEIISKDIVFRSDGSKKANLDMQIAFDMEDFALANAYDTAILVSGDGDFDLPVKRVQNRSKRVEVASFPANTQRGLRTIADYHHDLTQMRR